MILITGASEGIGFACAQALLRRTTSPVLITGRSREKLERARAAVALSAAARLDLMVCDQSRDADLDALATRLRAEDVEGAILAVGVNPAYTEGPRRLHLLERGTVEATIRTNCTHTLLLTAVLLERFRQQRRGALVWIGSQGAAAGLPGAALYCATKSFLSGLARAVHREYGAHGVRVHVAHPGLVRTPRTRAVADAFAARHRLEVAEAGDVADRIVDLLLGGCPTVEVNLN